MKAHIILVAAAIVLSACAVQKNVESSQNKFPAVENDGCTSIVAHRGFWQCEEAAYSENSIVALKAACENGFRGCELDIHITADGQIIVNHDGSINGKEISTHNLADFDSDLLPDGNRRPTLAEYLKAAKPYRNTQLVIEFKSGNPALLDGTFKLLRKYGMLKPERVMFISFSLDACKYVAANYPAFTNQYLNGSLSPDELAALGINGLDYGFWEFREHPEWVARAHELGMSVNTWTVDYEGIMDEMTALGVDAITTNIPLALRARLGSSEFRK